MEQKLKQSIFQFAIVAVFAIAFTATNVFAAIKLDPLEYKQGDTTLEGFIAYNDATKKSAPGVLVVHDWMGVNDLMKKRAKELAEQGYVAMVVDIYGKGQNPKNQKEAGQLAGKFKNDRPLLRSRIQAAFDVLAKDKRVDAKQIAIIGFCFGGTTALELARSGAPVVGVVSFHGGLDNPTPADAAKIKGKVLVLHGAVDPYVKPEELAAFQKEMNEAKVDYQLISYANTVHAFTVPEAGNDPSKGAAYNALSEKRSFAATKQFFDEILRKK